MPAVCYQTFGLQFHTIIEPFGYDDGRTLLPASSFVLSVPGQYTGGRVCNLP